MFLIFSVYFLSLTFVYKIVGLLDFRFDIIKFSFSFMISSVVSLSVLNFPPS